jgi:glycosyltransferase involved in cell wall biosynthesis
MTRGNPRRLRVLFVIPAPAEGAWHIFSKRQADALERADIDLRRFYLHPWISLSTLVTEARRHWREVRQFKPDIVHAQYGTMTSALCAVLAPQKLVVTFRGSDLNPGHSVNFIRTRLGRILSQLSALRANRIVCVSQELKDRLWWRKSVAVVIPSAVDTHVFHPQPRDEARRSLGWDPSERLVLLNVRDDPLGKGLRIAEAAVEIARAEIGPIRLLVVRGDVPPERMPLYINASDCVLLASEWEGSPTIVQEAVACNVPVVATNVGDVALRLQGIFPSRIVERSPARLGAALAEVVSLGQRSNGTEKLGEISLDTTTRQLTELYNDVVPDVTKRGRAKEAGV